MPPDFLVPEWPAPAWIRACVSTRTGGVSTAEFASLNPAFHVGDDAEAVRRNRVIIAEAIGGDAQIQWLSQVHGTQVIEASSPGSAPEADGCFTRSTGLACAVMTADCLPVLLCDRLGTEVAAVHCGWRGLAAGIVQVAVERFQCPATDLLAWLGPAIGPATFEVGDDVREAFALRAKDAGWALGWDEAFSPSKRPLGGIWRIYMPWPAGNLPVKALCPFTVAACVHSPVSNDSSPTAETVPAAVWQVLSGFSPID